MSEDDSKTECGFSNPQENGGQECRPSVTPGHTLGTSTSSQEEGGQECPPSVTTPLPFFNPRAEIERHSHRLPHWQQGEVYYFVTWRLADALPQGKLDEWRDAKRT